jgi:hypothetical protein
VQPLTVSHSASGVDQPREFLFKSLVQNRRWEVSIEVGAKVTWRHGKSKTGKKGVRVPYGVANCIIIELAEDGRVRIRLPESFGNQQVKVLVADLEEPK